MAISMPSFQLTTVSLNLLILSAAVGMSMAMERKTQTVNEAQASELKCSTHLQYPVAWEFQHSDGTNHIFLGGEISKSFKGMFLLTGNQTLGEYNLLIPSADSRYPGNYTCVDDEGLGSELLSIQLSIIAPSSTIHKMKSTEIIGPYAMEVKNEEETSSNSSNLWFISIIVVVIAGVVVVAAVIVYRRKSHSKQSLTSEPKKPTTSRQESSLSSRSDSSTNPLVDKVQRENAVSVCETV